ncbi:39S ribosomal protein L53, mitochondrial-like [Homarus americanus]|uniref:Large ribosomal subunit protein mL53 n=1 Tax=Homarus americanus TaxID=6706 RepID=A0A8J5NB18_HOMAM|nr:39S ribosomal protein L53, mitochondrial-like [Homarus americanus]KAG7176229.1 39S ribosomal protein L53-like [Homarus americanus]
MALPYTHSGTFTRSAGLYSALAKQSSLLNLKPVKRITFSFDPLSEKAIVVRHTLNFFHLEKVRESNLKCLLKTTVLSTRADPTIEVKLVNGKTLLFKAVNLQPLEILKKFNELVSSQAEAESKTEVLTKGKLTKSQKKK